jgi:Methyltransferase domain
MILRMISEEIKTGIAAIVPVLNGWCTIEKAEYICNLVIENKLQKGVELGVFAGRSLVPLGWGFEETGGHITGIDPWTTEACVEGKNDKANDDWWSTLNLEDLYRSTVNILRQLGLDNIVTLVRKKSAEAVLDFEDGSLDLVHQDSNHSEQISCDEVERWTPKLKAGGFWIADDTNWPTTQKAQKLLVEKGYTELYDSGSWKVYRK